MYVYIYIYICFTTTTITNNYSITTSFPSGVWHWDEAKVAWTPGSADASAENAIKLNN